MKIGIVADRYSLVFPSNIPKTEGICVWWGQKLRRVILQQKFSQIRNAVENIHVLTCVCVIPGSITLIDNFKHRMHGVLQTFQIPISPKAISLLYRVFQKNPKTIENDLLLEFQCLALN